MLSTLVGLTLLLGQTEASPSAPVLSPPVSSSPTTTSAAVSVPPPTGSYGKYATDRSANGPAPGAAYLPYSSGTAGPSCSPYTTGSPAATVYSPYGTGALPYTTGPQCPVGAPNVRPVA